MISFAQLWIFFVLPLFSLHFSGDNIWKNQFGIVEASSGDDYEPRQCVRRMHNMPHLDSHLKVVDNKFAISADSAYNEYTRSLVIFPSILGAIGLIVLIGYVFGLFFRCCCRCCWSPPLKNDSNSNSTNHNKRNLTIVFFCCIAIIISFDFTILSGNTCLNKGVTRAIDAVDFVGDIFQTLYTDGDIMVDATESITDKVEAAIQNGCDEADHLTQYVDEATEAAESYLTYVEKVPEMTDNIHDAMRTYGIEKKNEIMWDFFGAIILFIVFFLVGYGCGSPWMIRFSMFLSFFLILGLLFMSVVLMIILMGAADFCMDPTESTLSVVGVKKNQQTIDTIEYYTSCEGANPFDDELEMALNSTQTIDAGVTILLNTVCPGDPYLLSIYDETQKIYTAIDDIYQNIICAPILDQWYLLMNKGVCKDIFTGIYRIWVALYFSTFFFIVLSITGSILYQYFGLKDIPTESFQSSFDHRNEGVELPEAIPAAAVVVESQFIPPSSSSSPTTTYEDYSKEKEFIAENPTIYSANSIRY